MPFSVIADWQASSCCSSPSWRPNFEVRTLAGVPPAPPFPQTSSLPCIQYALHHRSKIGYMFVPDNSTLVPDPLYSIPQFPTYKLPMRNQSVPEDIYRSSRSPLLCYPISCDQIFYLWCTKASTGWFRIHVENSTWSPCPIRHVYVYI